MKINIPNFYFQPTPRIPWLTVVLVLLLSNFVTAQTTQTFTTNGTFTVPRGVTSITVEAWGAGGGGGSASSNFTYGSGGGGGAYAKSIITVTPEATYNVIVGNGGSADNNGGNSTFNVNTVIAAGGFGGSSSSTIGGSGGSIAASIGTIRYAGGNGGNAISGTSSGGGGGAGSTGGGGDASGITGGIGTSLNGGNGGDGVDSNSNGNDGLKYGGGGSGARRSGGPSRTGGSGANGLVVISWVTGPILSVTPTTLNLGYVANGGTSSSLTYALSGSNLSGAPGNITVTAPINFEVSLAAGSGYASSISVPYSSSSLASTTIYVRFKPTASNTDYTGTITNSGGGSATVNVAVTGTSKLTYCTLSGNTSYQTSITGVLFNTINSIDTSIKLTGYKDYTAQVTNVNIGNTYDLSVRVNTAGSYTNYTNAWIDWNQDGDFDDDGETFDLGTAYNVTNGLTNLSPKSITIPSGAALGNTRMRVATKYNAYPTSCETTTFDGEVEDYTINILPCIPPTITNTAPASRCGTGTINLGATASNGTINWYAASSGGSSLGTGTSFVTPSISSTTTYWVDATLNGCTTASRTAVTATINLIPSITGTTTASRCGTGTVVLGANSSAGTINWYAASSGGSSLGTGTSFVTPSISSTTTYWVDATLNGCTTVSRTAVTATVNATPTATAGSAIAVCTGTSTITMIGASVGGTNSGNSWSGGGGFGTWSQNANPALATFTPTTSSGSFTATLTVTGSGSCLGTNPTATRTITWETTPTIIGTSPASRCGTGTVTLGATASAGTINWYTASTGGASIGTGTSFTTPSISSTTTYWVEATNGGCTSTTRTAVIATINADIANNTFNFTAGNFGTISTNVAENATAILTAPTGTYFMYVGFASYGTPTGSFPNFTVGSCHATSSQSVTEAYLLGKVGTINIPATNGVFGDPCIGTLKSLAVQASYTATICNGTSPGLITGTTPTGGNGTFTYLWESSTTSATTGFGNAAGTNTNKDYTPLALTQTTWLRRTVSSGGCSNISAVILLQVNAAISAPTVGTITQPSCATPTGSVVLSGLPAGNWTINPGGITGNELSTTITGLATSTYNFTVTNAIGCTSVASTNVVINAQPTTPSAPTLGTITQPTCALATGSVVLNGLPATGTWTLTRSPGAITNTGTGTSTTISGLEAGTYNYTVTNAAGCTSVASTNVVINAQPTTPSAPTLGTITQPTCALATGSVVLNGLPTGNWTINPGGITGNALSTTITGLATGTYNFTVTNAAGCTSVASVNVVINTQPVTPTTPSVSVTQPTCATATGTITVTVQTASDTYSFDNGVTFQASNSKSGLVAGNYNVIIKSAGECNSSPNATTINIQPVTSTITPSSTGSFICIGSTATLSVTGAVSGDRYTWYTASSGGTLLKTSTNNTDNTFITPILSATTSYWVAILNSNGCESERTQVTATFPATSADNQNLAGTNTWVGHVYKRLDAVAQPPTDVNAYTNYYGRITEAETFNESFGGATVCFPLTASESPRSIYTEYFAVKFLMNSDKTGIYLADIGSDDGARLTVDGVKIYDQWVQRAYINNTKILFQLNGSSNLMLEYFESGGGNQVSFQNLTKVPNNLNSGTSQAICLGESLIAIAANNVLTDAPISSTAGYTVAYQWQQSSNIAGPFSDISGATSQNYTPTVSSPGTYYFKRKITVTKTNLGSIVVNAIDFSSVAQVVITPAANIDSVTGANALCIGNSTTYIANNVVLGGGSGLWSSNNTAVATVNSAGLVTTVSPGTTTISYTITGGCGGTKTATQQLTVLSTTIATPGTITGSASQCPSATAQVYSIAAVTNATTYTWSVPTGWSITAGAGTTSITVTSGTAGQNGNISVTAGNSCGTSAARTLAVVVNSCINKWKGSVSTNWNTPGNWTQNLIPAIDADIIFDDSPVNHCVLDQNRSVTDITNTQATYRIVLNGYQLTIKGTTIFSGGAQIDATANNSTLVFAGTELQTLNAAQLLNANVYNLTVNNTNNVRLIGSLNLLNNLTATSGRLDVFTNSPTLVYNGTAAQNIMTNTLLDDKIHHLTIDNTVGVNLNTNLTVVQNLTINNSKSLLVASTVQFTALGTITNNGGNSGLVLKSDTNGTASLLHNTNNVPVTAHRYISRNAEDWHFLSSPVSNQEINSTWLPVGSYGTGNPLTGTGYDLYVWNEETFCWIYKSDTSNWNLTHPTTNFDPGRGYLYSVQATKPTKTFEGSLNNGIFNYPLTRSITTDVSLKELEGFNLVGNPFPSSIDWSASSGWTRTALAESGGGKDMWIWNPEENNYGVYNSNTQIGTNSITRYIAPMQGYFVKAASSGNLGFDNSVRVHTGAGNWFKPSGSKSHLIRVNVQSEAGNGGDEALLQFGIPKNQWGASKIFSHVKTAPSLYLNTVKEAYSVQYLSTTTENTSVPVAFKAGVNGNYQLTLNFDPDEFELVLLEDKHSKSVQIILPDEQYQFKANTNDSANRFVIHFTEIKNNDTAFPAKMYTDGRLLYVDLSAIETSSELMVYDMLGKLLLKTTLKGNTLHTLPVSYTAQILMVRLQNQEGVLSRKLLFYKL